MYLSTRSTRRSPVILSDTDYDALLAACRQHPMLYLYVLLLGDAALRVGEALALQWHDVNLQQGILRVRTGRTRRPRYLPIGPRLRSALAEHTAAYGSVPTPWVLHHLGTRGVVQAGARIRSLLATRLRTAALKAGLPTEFRAMDLRYRRIRLWLDEGHTRHLVALATGSSPQYLESAFGHPATDVDFWAFVRQ